MAEQRVPALERGAHPATEEGLSADAFRSLEVGFRDAKVQHAMDAEIAALAQRRQWVKALIDQHFDDAKWQELLHQARQAAEHGEMEYLLLRFPSALCTDNARAINNPPNEGWPETLQGEAAELYALWQDQLSRRGVPHCRAGT